MTELPFVAAGREIPDAMDRIRRYCGLAWSGGRPETWAWHYYDAVPTPDPHRLDPTDVTCAAALHPGLSRRDLAWFREATDDIEAWLAGVPTDARLSEITDEHLDHLVSMPTVLSGAPVSLVSKVLHRKRPHLIPPVDGHIIDWYRPVTGKRAAAEAWEPLMRAMHDEWVDDEWRLLTAIALGTVESEIWPDVDPFERPGLSWLRAFDIAIWMESR